MTELTAEQVITWEQEYAVFCRGLMTGIDSHETGALAARRAHVNNAGERYLTLLAFARERLTREAADARLLTDAKEAIEAAIYDEDGLDAAKGNALWRRLSRRLTPTSAAEPSREAL